MGRANDQFEKGRDDDLNTSAALAALFVLIGKSNVALEAGELREDNRQQILKWLQKVDDRLGVIPPMEGLVQSDKEAEEI